MEPATRYSDHYDLNLSCLADEELVVLAQECAFQPAVHALMLRHHGWLNGLIARKSRRTGFGTADVDDAQQEAVFWMSEAIAQYDTLELARPRGCRFRSFLYAVISARLHNFVRHVRRLNARYRRAGGPLEAGTTLSPSDRVRLSANRRRRDNPAAGLERKENQPGFEIALNRISNAARHLWDCLAAGIGLRDFAQQRGLSYDQAKRQRQKLLAQLTAWLRD